MNEARERREREEREASEEQEREARDRGDTATADAISRAREKGIANNHGQRDRYIERESDRIQDAIRQDRTDSEVRQAAVERGDTDFVRDIDRARERRYGKDSSAVEADRRRYDATLDQETLDRRGGQGGDRGGDQGGYQPPQEELAKIYQATQLDAGEHTNPDGSTTFVEVDNLGNRHIRLYKTDAAGGEYLQYSVVVRPDDTVALQSFNQFGEPIGSGVETAGDGVLKFIGQPGLTPEQREAQDSQVLAFLEGRDYDTDSMTLEDAYAEYNRLVRASRVQGEEDAATVYAFLEQRDYDIGSMSLEQAYAEYNRLAMASRVQSDQLLERLEGQYTEAFSTNDGKALAELADSGAGDALEVTLADGTTTTYTQFLRGEIRRLAEFNRIQSGEFDMDPDHDAQEQITRQKELTELQFALDPEGRSVSNLFTGAPIVVDGDTGGVFIGADAFKKGLRDTAQQREDLVDYLGDNIDPVFAKTARIEELKSLAGFRQSVDTAKYRQQVLDYLGDNIDPAFAASASMEELRSLAGFREGIQRQKLDAFNFAQDPEAGRPSFIGPTITGNEFEDTIESNRLQQVLRTATAIEDDDRADMVERAVTDFKPVLVSYDTDPSKIPTTITLDTPWDDDLFGDAVDEHRQNQDLWSKGLNSEEAQNLKGLYGYALANGKEEEAQKIAGIIERATDHNPREAWRFLATALPLAFLGGGGLVASHAAIGAVAGSTIAPTFTYATPRLGTVWNEAVSTAAEGGLFNTETFNRIVQQSVAEGKLKPGEAAQLRTAFIVGGFEGAGIGAATGGVLGAANQFLSRSVPKVIQAKTPALVKGPGVKYVVRPNQEALLETGLVDTGLDYIGGDAPTLSRFRDNYLQNYFGDRVWSAYSGVPGAAKEAATFASRTFGPSEIQFTLPGWGEVTIEGPGGFSRLATPAEGVPRLFTDKGPQQADIAHQVYQQIADTGSFKGIIDGQVVEFESGPMAEAFMEANPGRRLYYHASPNIQRLVDSPEVLPKAGMSQQEQYAFFSVEPVSKFELSAAYGGKGDAPGMLVTTSPDIELGYVLDANGDIKYYKKGYEGEGGAPVWETLSDQEVRALASPHGDVWATESVQEPEYWNRVVANLEGLGEAITFQRGGGFNVRPATAKDYAGLPEITGSERQMESALEDQKVRWVTRLRDRIDVIGVNPDRTPEEGVNLEKMKTTLADWQRMWGVRPLPRGSVLPETGRDEGGPTPPQGQLPETGRDEGGPTPPQGRLPETGRDEGGPTPPQGRLPETGRDEGGPTPPQGRLPETGRDEGGPTPPQGSQLSQVDRQSIEEASQKLLLEIAALHSQLERLEEVGAGPFVRESLNLRVEELQGHLAQARERVGEVPANVRQRVDAARDRLAEQIEGLQGRLVSLPEGVLRRVIERRIARLERELASLQQVDVRPEDVLREESRPETVRPGEVRPETVRPEEEVSRPSYPVNIDVRPEDTRAEEDVRREESLPETVRPETVRPEETRPEETRPEETRPEEIRPEEIRPEEIRPEEIRPEETRPEEIRPEEIRPEETRPEETRPEEIRPEEIRPEEIRPEEIRPEETRPEETRPEEVRPEEIRPEEVRPETVRPETVRPEEVRPETVRPETVRPETVRPETVRPETVRPETVRPEEVRPVNDLPETRINKWRLARSKESEETETPQRQLTTGQEYPEAVTWETYELNTYDPQTGELTTEPLDNTEVDSIEVQGRTDKRPQAGQAKLGNITFSNDFEGQLAEQVEGRIRDSQEEAPFDANLPSDASNRRQLTQDGRFPDMVLWLARNRKTWDPQTGQFTSKMVDDTAMETVQIQGETTEPPVSPDARVGNLRVQSDGQGAAVEAVPNKALSLPKTGLPKAKDAPAGNRGKKKGLRGRRGSKGSRNDEEILTEMTGQAGVVEAPVILVK